MILKVNKPHNLSQTKRGGSMDKNKRKFSSIEDAVNWFDVIMTDGRKFDEMSNFVHYRCKVRERQADNGKSL